ncbi:MAG: cytochrome P450 [Alphaproteobacteria bacterium]
MTVHTPVILAENRGLRLLRRVRRDLLGEFVRMMRRHGDFTWMELGGHRVLMLNDATGIQHVLQDNAASYRKSHFNQVLRPLLGDSIFLSEGATWRKQRHEAAPVFSSGNFAEMTTQIVGATESMLNRWTPHIARDEPLCLNNETMTYTLDVVLRALFHEAREGVAPDMQTALVTLLREAEHRIWSPLNLPQSLTYKIPKYRRARQFLDNLVGELAEARRCNAAYPDDLLSRLVAGYGTSTHEQAALHDQIKSFLLAGHETTANGLVWTFCHLSRHPEIARRVTQEVDQILGDTLPTFESVKNLNYTRQVFDEVLRLYPPVWTMSRTAAADDMIPLDNGDRIALPRDTVVMMSGYAVHRREKYWDNPEAFDPDRFAPEAVATRPKFSWFPFGGGPRLCLGFRFAQIESIVAIAMVVQRYRLCLVPGQNIAPMPIITLRPNGAVLFNIRPRGNKTCPVNFSAAQNAVPRCPMNF